MLRTSTKLPRLFTSPRFESVPSQSQPVLSLQANRSTMSICFFLRLEPRENPMWITGPVATAKTD